ncbi:uncharacterized protein [Penaeus vannamei]|uniref:uncharacterized protein n=1 Tax=Penaeus vannamei TaxID=6689 RepID=UPI00387F8CD5
MAVNARQLIIFGLVVTVFCLVGGNPTRELAGDINSDPDTAEISDEQESGVLGRLWSSLSNLTGLKKRDTGERLERFRRELLTSWHHNIKTVTHASKRYRRGLEDGLVTDTEGYWLLTNLDDNVSPRLKSLNAPTGTNSMTIFEHDSRLFLVATHGTGIVVYSLNLSTDTFEQAMLPSQAAFKCVPVLKHTEFIEIVCAESLTDQVQTGSGVYSITWKNGLRVKFVRTLITHAARDVCTWENDDYVFIAMANSFDASLNTVECSSEIYRMETTVTPQGTYTNYDKIDAASFITKNARGLEAFKIMTNQFIAVANHMDNKGNVEVDSEIFIYDHHYARMRPFQRIRTSAARDWAAFHFSNGKKTEYFLAVANEFSFDAAGRKNYNIDSIIYRYDEASEKFLPFQCIPTQGAYQWITYKGPHGEVLLGVVNSASGVAFYQYNGWRFVRINIPVSAPGVEWAWIGKLPNTLNEVLFMMSSSQANPRPASSYLEFTYQNPLGTYHNATAEWCSAYKTEMTNDGLSQLVLDMEQAPKTNESYTFTKPVHIDGSLTLPAGSAVSEVRDILCESESMVVDYNFHADTKTLIDDRKALETKLGGVQNTVSQSRSINSPNLDGLHFANLVTTCNTPGCIASTVDSLTANTVNGVSASYTGIALLNNTNEKLDLTFADVALAGGAVCSVTNIKAHDTAVIPMNELVTLHQDHTITADVTFNKVLADNMQVSGTVDGLTVDDSTLLLTYGTQTVNGLVTVDGVDTTLITTTNVNSRNFNDFIDSLIVNGTTDSFQGLLEVGDDLIAPNIDTLEDMKPLNPVDVEARALFHTKTSTQVVTGLHSVGNLEAVNGVWFDHLNGVLVPDDVFLKDETVTVSAPTTFDSITATSIQVTNAMNDVKQVGGSLEFLLLDKDATLTSKTFTDLTLEKDSTVAKLVAGYDLDYLAKGLHEKFLQDLNSGRAVNGSVIFEKELHVTSDKIHGVSIGKIRDTAIPLTATSLNPALTFEKPVPIAGAMTVSSTINGVAKDDYVLLDSDHTIVSPKTFVSDMECREDVTAGLVSGYNLAKFAKDVVLKKGPAQVIVQDLSMASADVNGDLNVAGQITIGGVNFNNVVALNATETVRGKKTFTNVEVTSSTSAGAVNVGDFGTVDGVVVKEIFFDDSLRKSVTSTQELVGRAMDTIIAQNAEGTDLAGFERKVVYKDDIETISGALTLEGSVSIASLNFESDFDGVSEAAYKSAWLLNEGPQTLTGSNSLANVDASAVNFQGIYVDGVHLGRLHTVTAKIDEQTTLNSTTFDQVESLSGITLDGTIQGWHLHEQALQSSSNHQRVTGKKRFTNPVHIKNSITVDENVIIPRAGGSPLVLEMSQFCDAFMQNGKVLGDLVVNGNAVFNKDLDISKSFNNEDVSTLASVFWLSDMDNTVSSVKQLDTAQVAGNAEVIMKGLINGEDFSTLASDVLKNKCTSQSVTASWNLDNLEVSSLQTDTVTNTLLDSDVFDLERILRTDKTQTITGAKTFPEVQVAGSVDLDGTLNGLDVKTNLVQYGKGADITAPKTFNQKLTVKGDLSMTSGTTVQGVDVSAFEESAVLHNTSGITKSIGGITTFKGLVLKTLEVGGTVDTVQVDSNTILLTSGAQSVAGLVTVSVPGQDKVVFVDQNLEVQDQMFNTIKLDKLYGDTVRVDGSKDTITAEVTFTASPTFSSITLENHLVNGYNLTDLILFLDGKHTLDNMGDHLEEAIQSSQDSNMVLEERPTDLWYFYETKLQETLYKLQPITLASPLGHRSIDAFVGLNWEDTSIQIYGPELGRKSLADELKDICEEKEHLDVLAAFPPTSTISIPKAKVAAGLGNNHLAACGDSLVTFPYAAAPTYQQISDELGQGTSYGHVFSLNNPVQTVVSFSTVSCKDLVPFHLENGKDCLAVIDHGTTSEVICGTAQTGYRLLNYLGTKRAVKGAAFTLGNEYLVVLEDDSFSFSSNLKTFKYDLHSNTMVLELNHDLQKASHLDALAGNHKAYVAVTHSISPVAAGGVDIFTVTDKSGSVEMKKMQTIKVPGALASNFGELAKYDVGLFVQTEHGVHVYVLKGMQFVHERMVKTVPARKPFSFPFFHTGQNTTFLLYAGNDLDGHLERNARVYEAVYRP